MKQSRIFLGLIAIILVSMAVTSCTKESLRKLGQFTMGPFETTFTIPANAMVGGVVSPFLSSNIPTNSENTFSGNKTGKEYVESITLSDMTLTVENASTGGNFDFIKEIRVSITATGLPEKEIATKLNLADGLTTIDMDETGENLKEYLSADKFSLKTNTVFKTSAIANVETKVKISTKYTVQANILQK